MAQLCFATFTKTLLPALLQPHSPYNTTTSSSYGRQSSHAPRFVPATNEYAVQFLLDWIADFGQLEDKEGNPLTPSKDVCSKLLKQTAELNQNYISVLNDGRIYKEAERHFDDLSNQLVQEQITDLISAFCQLLKDDPDVSEERCKEFLKLASGDLNIFLARLFIYAATKPNKLRNPPTIDPYDLLALTRFGDICPACRKSPLLKTIKGKRVANAELVTVPGTENEEPFDIAVCRICAQAALLPSLLDEDNTLGRLRRHYRNIVAKEQIQETMLEYAIQADISKIVSSFSRKIDFSDLTDLSFEALSIEQKVRPEHFSLIDMLRGLVTRYYRFVEQQFNELDGIGKNNFSLIAMQVRAFYEDVSCKSADQDLIFESIVEWIRLKADAASVDGARIVAAFFVQNCEVFNEAT